MDEKIKFEAIYTTTHQVTIGMIKSLLEANSINYYVDNENAAILGSPETLPWMTIMVAKDQAGIAKALLKGIKELLKGIEG